MSVADQALRMVRGALMLARRHAAERPAYLKLLRERREKRDAKAAERHRRRQERGR